jgi:hypothetical protein
MAVGTARQTATKKAFIVVCIDVLIGYFLLGVCVGKGAFVTPLFGIIVQNYAFFLFQPNFFSKKTRFFQKKFIF